MYSWIATALLMTWHLICQSRHNSQRVWRLLLVRLTVITRLAVRVREGDECISSVTNCRNLETWTIGLVPHPNFLSRQPIAHHFHLDRSDIAPKRSQVFRGIYHMLDEWLNLFEGVGSPIISVGITYIDISLYLFESSKQHTLGDGVSWLLFRSSQ